MYDIRMTSQHNFRKQKQSYDLFSFGWLRLFICLFVYIAAVVVAASLIHASISSDGNADLLALLIYRVQIRNSN